MEVDPDPNPNESSVTLDVVANEVDLRVVKSASVSSAVIGEPFTYYVWANNVGPAIASEVVVADVVPDNFQIDSTYNPATGEACDVDGQEVTCELGDLYAGWGSYVSIEVTPLTAELAVTNTATISSSSVEVDPDPNPNESSVTFDVDATEVDLWIEKTSSDPTPVVGEPFTFNLWSHNAGPAIARDLVVTDVVPDNFQIDSTYNPVTGEACDVDGQTVTCELGDQNPYWWWWSHSVTIEVTPVTPGEAVTNTATITSTTPEVEDETYPNESSVTLDVAPNEVNLYVIKDSSDPTPVVGEPFTYYVYAHNLGPAIARDVVVTDVVPDNFQIDSTYNSVTGEACDVDGQTVTCDLGDRSPGGSWVYIDVTPVTVSLDVTNTATISSSTPEVDPDPNPNSSSLTLDVDAHEVDLGIEKTATVASAVVGEPFTYHISASSQGPAIGRDVVVTDVVPDNFQIDATQNWMTGQPCDVDGQTVTCEIGDVNPYWWWTLAVSIDVTPITAGAAVTNTATISSSTVEVDPDPNPNESSVTLDVNDVTAELMGSVTSVGGAPVSGAQVRLYREDSSVRLATVLTGPDGSYSFGDVLEPGGYKVVVVHPDHLTQWYSGRGSFGTATVIGLTAGEATAANLVLQPRITTGTVSGVVTSVGGAPASGVLVRLYDTTARIVGYRLTGGDGSYEFSDVAPGVYRVLVIDSSGTYLSPQWVGGGSFHSATQHPVTAGQATTVNATLVPTATTGSVRGVVTTVGGAPAENLRVILYDTDALMAYTVFTAEDGSYSFVNVTPGTYRVRVRELTTHEDAWWLGKSTWRTADPVEVTAGGEVAGIDITVTPLG